MLVELGHDVDTVSSAIEVLSAVHRVAYDIVLIDIHAPLLDGLRLTARIRAGLSEHLQPRVVAVSASERDEDRLTSIRAGMDAYLSKPLRLHQLDLLLTELVSTPANPGADRAGSPDPANARTEAIWERLVDAAGQDLTEDALFFAELLRSLAARAPQMLDDLETAVRRHDLDAVAFDAHRMKGSVSNLGGTELAGQLHEIERQARLGGPLDQNAMSRTRDELNHLRISLRAVADDLERQTRYRRVDEGQGAFGSPGILPTA